MPRRSAASCSAARSRARRRSESWFGSSPSLSVSLGGRRGRSLTTQLRRIVRMDTADKPRCDDLFLVSYSYRHAAVHPRHPCCDRQPRRRLEADAAAIPWPVPAHPAYCGKIGDCRKSGRRERGVGSGCRANPRDPGRADRAGAGIERRAAQRCCWRCWPSGFSCRGISSPSC